MRDWKTGISATILKRGADYHKRGYVRSLENRDDGWHAQVAGSSTYTVFVPLSLDNRRATCTCPHFARGYICKHIVATFTAIDAQTKPGDGDASANGNESVEDIVARIEANDLRAFVIDTARKDARIERALRATFGVADAREAKRELQKATSSIKQHYEYRGFIDWEASMGFESEYLEAIESIMQPFYSSKDVDGLIELAVPRLVQLQRISIDDSNGFFSNAIAGVTRQLDHAFDLGDGQQRQRLFEALTGFIERNPGKDRGNIYWFEKDAVENFLAGRFARDEQFAPQMIELADGRLAPLPPAGPGDYDPYRHDRSLWASARVSAMAALGEAPDALQEFAEKHDALSNADVVRLIANAHLAAGSAKDAMSVLADHLDAAESYHSRRKTEKPPRLVDLLIDITAEHCTKRDLMMLYVTLLISRPYRSTPDEDVCHWYDELRELTAKDRWAGVRAQLLGDVPYERGNTLLAHEGSLDELYARIEKHDGRDLMRFEHVLAKSHPEPYVDHYIGSALSLMDRASDRRMYQDVARDLKRAASLPGGKALARAAADEFREKYPRRPALHDELRRVGLGG